MLINYELANIDFLYPTDNEFGIPCLELEMQASGVQMPVEAWGAIPRTRTMLGTYVLYVIDTNINVLWKEPRKLIVSGCRSVTEANFSINKDMPLAVALYQIYRKRWLSKFWHEEDDVKVFVDLNVPERFDNFNLLGIPDGWRTFATRGRSNDLEGLERQLALAKKKAGTDKVIFLVYAGGKEIEKYCWQNKLVYVVDDMNRVKFGRKLEGKETVKFPPHFKRLQLAS